MKHKKEWYTCDIDGCDNKFDSWGFEYALLKDDWKAISLSYEMWSTREDEVHVCKDCQITLLKMHIDKLEAL